jgi:hypothetical protein
MGWPRDTVDFPEPTPLDDQREWTQDEIDRDCTGDDEPFICPVTQQPCLTEQDEFCEDYGCARKAGIGVDGEW